MSYSARVSKVAVLEQLKKYLADELADDIFADIVKADENDHRNMIGMTYGEWADRFDDDRQLVWADDTHAGFGRRGDSVYGDNRDCVICMTEYDGRRYKLWVWCETLHTEDRRILAAMAEYHRRHEAVCREEVTG